jgi:hypothetical protein
MPCLKSSSSCRFFHSLQAGCCATAMQPPYSTIKPFDHETIKTEAMDQRNNLFYFINFQYIKQELNEKNSLAGSSAHTSNGKKI